MYEEFHAWQCPLRSHHLHLGQQKTWGKSLYFQQWVCGKRKNMNVLMVYSK